MRAITIFCDYEDSLRASIPKYLNHLVSTNRFRVLARYQNLKNYTIFKLEILYFRTFNFLK
jgi:hypothetical protein